MGDLAWISLHRALRGPLAAAGTRDGYLALRLFGTTRPRESRRSTALLCRFL